MSRPGLVLVPQRPKEQLLGWGGARGQLQLAVALDDLGNGEHTKGAEINWSISRRTLKEALCGHGHEVQYY